MRSLYTPLALVAVCSVAVLAKSPFRPDDGSGSEYTPTPVALSDPVETTASLDPYETTATLAEDSPAPYAEETLAPADSVDPYEATTSVAQDASAPYSEETPAPLIEETSAPIALADAYETPAPVAQETSAAYAEETPAPLAQDAYAPAVEETPAPIAQEETPAPIAEEETPAPVAEETLASDASSYRRALRRQRQAVITTTARPGSNASEESGKDASTCTASASCFHDDDCGSTGEKKGRCIGIFNGKCNCNACLNFLTCSDDSACGGLKGACNTTTSRCSCDEGYKANGFAGGFLDAFRELCNVKDCNANNHAEQCFGLPCNSGRCIC